MNHNRYAHDAVRSMRPHETRLVRGRHSGTVTLITGKVRRKRAFAHALPDERKNVSCIQHDGTFVWLVQSPSEEAQRALRELGWVELSSFDRPIQVRVEPRESGPKEAASRRDRMPTSRQNFRPCRPRRQAGGRQKCAPCDAERRAESG